MALLLLVVVCICTGPPWHITTSVQRSEKARFWCKFKAIAGSLVSPLGSQRLSMLSRPARAPPAARSPGLHWPLRPPPAPHQGKVTSSGQLASSPPVSMPGPPDFGLGPHWPGLARPGLLLVREPVSSSGKGEHGPASLHRREQAQLSSISRLVSPHSSSGRGDAIPPGEAGQARGELPTTQTQQCTDAKTVSTPFNQLTNTPQDNIEPARRSKAIHICFPILYSPHHTMQHGWKT